MNSLPPAEQPTQCRAPGHAVTRSTAATFVALGPLVPILVQHIGADRAMVVFAVALAGNALVTRILAIPQVELFLRSALPFMAADAKRPEAGRHREAPQ